MIVITGQTATGKTKLALEYAQKYDGELINCDSRQIYKYLDIITGKDREEKSKVKSQKSKVWLYDIVKPNEYFSSFDFVELATPIIKDIEDRNKTPILVGGTYLYLKHLLYGIDGNNSPPDFKLRDRLNDKSVDYLQKTLVDLNPETFSKLNHSDQLNPRRLIRKIEIESYHQKNVQKLPIHPISLISHISQFIGLKHKDKSKLRQVIEKRVGERLKNGAIEEVKKLLKIGYSKNDPGLKTIGYQQIIKYLNRQITEEQAIEDWINKEVQYAKRQYTFMKKDKNISWREV
ncbi:MAG: tRNA (adenosine(37)-N6)-dimethylallyltransferase MiaA [Candidatus Roizmanbacteria bacterium]|nr:tRNA (adenosine(37)-N6)-dimethylallyltransferase MiaA [Candidatus Roizmanbacteria bacterium]